MTFDEEKKIFVDREFIEIDGKHVFDGSKWREACSVVGEWLQTVSDTESYTSEEGMVEELGFMQPKKTFGKLDMFDKIRAEIQALSPEPTAHDLIDGNPIKDAV